MFVQIKAVINTLTWTCVQLTCILLTPPGTKALLLLSDPDLQAPSWDSMCYTSHSPFAKPPAALLPIPPIYRWHCSLTPYTRAHTCTSHKKHSHTQQTVNDKLALCGERREKHMAKTSRHSESDQHNIYHSNFIPALSAWDCIFTRTQFLFLSHT